MYGGKVIHMDNYKPELNFVTQFNLSRNGMILEIKEEFNILRLALSQISELGNEYVEMLDRIMVMPLRKLLFENQHPSILLEVCPDFKMPKLNGFCLAANDKLNMILPPYQSGEIDEWLPVEDWGKQYIAYFDKDEKDIPSIIPEDTFIAIRNQLKKDDKSTFSSFFDFSEIKFKGEDNRVYMRKATCSESDNVIIFELMSKAGDYSLTVYDFIKHLSDKRGAHIDFGLAPLVKMMNDSNNVTPVQCFALQLIFAAKLQIPELKDYWPELVLLP